MERQQRETRCPLASFRIPCVEDAQRTDDEEGSRKQAFIFLHLLAKRKSLHCLAQAHLVRKDPANSILAKIKQERQALKLVRFELRLKSGPQSLAMMQGTQVALILTL